MVSGLHLYQAKIITEQSSATEAIKRSLQTFKRAVSVSDLLLSKAKEAKQTDSLLLLPPMRLPK